MQKADALIRTKLRQPFTRLELVPRPRLQARIREGLGRPLTLITAPAGFGKTTLVASCVTGCGIPVAWLSLDKDDNQAERFLNYLVAALQEADPTTGSEAAQLLAAARQAPPEAVLTSLINDLVAAGREMVLVLDDYQFVSSQAVHEGVTFLLEHCPRTFHLVIATRSDPPLPVSRLRARGQAVELRAAELRFTEPEATRFLNDVMGLGLDAGSIAMLEQRTEGWIAGLQMAALALQGALSMRDRQDVRGFIEAFSGTHRYILDYLLEEVLVNQPPEIQHFLLYTSILERLSAPLCEAVLGDGEPKLPSSDPLVDFPADQRTPQTMLEYLERANLFLVALDGERIWYRYHHLFADLLRSRLQQTLGAQELAALHTRAARWYEENGLAYEAIHHASLISDHAWIERLIEKNYMEMFQRRDSSSIRFWTGQLSRESIYERPRLCIYEAMSRSWLGQLDDADLFLDQAEKRIREKASAPETRAMRGHLAYVRSRVTAMRGDVRRAIDLCLTARENTPASNQGLLGGIGVMLGYGYFLDGDFPNAIQTLNETIQSGITAGAVNTTVGAYCVLARLYAIQGRLHRSFELYREAGEFAGKMGRQDLGAQAIVEVGIADVLYEWNDLEAALSHMQQGLESIPSWNKADDIALAYTTHSRIQQAQGNTAAAVETIEKASRLIQARGVFAEARDAVATAEIRLGLSQGDSLAVGRRSRSLERGASPAEPLRFGNEWVHITLARLFLAQDKVDESLRLLSRLGANARSGGRRGRLIEILALEALALQKAGDAAQADSALAASLALAEPEGYRRVFLDEGRPMQSLLAQWLAHADAGPLQDYASHLLSQFDAEPQVGTAAQDRVPPTGGLIEPLSLRELEVLHLVALGRTNKEIAQQLIVAPGTIKAHTSSIYRKLDVANRTEAVARARQLGLLP